MEKIPSKALFSCYFCSYTCFFTPTRLEGMVKRTSAAVSFIQGILHIGFLVVFDNLAICLLFILQKKFSKR